MRLTRRDPRELKRLSGEENARYMTPEQYHRLVENIRRDGRLTSVPLVYEPDEPDEMSGRVISGNHRVRAAIDAGLTEIDVMEIKDTITPERFRAIQLSHNAIAGSDDPAILLRLYSELPVVEREYSGLSDDDFEELAKQVDMASAPALPEHALMLSFSFMPDEADEFVRAAQAFQHKAKENPVLVARYADFDHFFDAVAEVKERNNVYNVAAGLLLMAQLAKERLAQMEGEDERDG